MTTLPKHLASLNSAFGKDMSQEALLADVNALIAPVQRQLEQRAPASPLRPVVLVLGPPRSGTTLVSQLITTSRLFGTVCNLAARFWEAPAFGLLLAQALGISEETASHFTSRRGVTEGWGEASEFGYFWNRYFDLGQDTHALDEGARARFDRAGLCRSVAAMEAVVVRPMAFKNNTWFTFHADLLSEVFPAVVLVACRRDPFFVAQSMYMQRLDLYGDASRWWSVRPPRYAEIVNLSPVDQVAVQVLSIAAEMERSLARVRQATVVDAAYPRLVVEPRRVLREIATAAGLREEEIASGVERVPQQFTSTDVLKLPPDVARDLRGAVDRFTDAASGSITAHHL